MARWRKEAFDRLPELRKLLQVEKSPYLFLGEMVGILHQAYLRADEDLIRRIYEYAKWCMNAPRGVDASDDMLTIVAVSFFEDLPQFAEVRRDVGRWFPKEEIQIMKSIFTYHGTEEQYQEMLESCNVTKFQRKRG